MLRRPSVPWRARALALPLLLTLPLAWSCSRGGERNPNLLLVTIDTVRADHLGCYGDRDAITPFLNRLAN